MFYTNGYIVKEPTVNREFAACRPGYRGLESYRNWPLSDREDAGSKRLTTLLEKHFDQNNYVEIIADANLLQDYVNYCEKSGIEVVVMKIMTEKNTVVADKDFQDMEVLGYDCIAGDSVSYLAEIYTEGADEIALYKTTKKLVNSNGLFNDRKEADDFIAKRNKLIERGLNLEDYREGFPAKLSLVRV